MANQTMKIKTSRNSSRIKEDIALHHILKIAKNYKNKDSYTDQVKDNITRSENEKKVIASKDAPKFSGKITPGFAKGFIYGKYENIKEQIELELQDPNTTKTRKKKLKKQLKDVISKIESSKTV